MNKKNLILVLIIIFFCFFFIISKSNQTTIKKGLKKNNEIISDKYVEAAPFVWDDELKYIIFQRDEDNKKYNLVIYDYKTREKISTFGEGIALGSALVHDEKLYIFATRNWSTKVPEVRSEVVLITTSDLKTFSDPVTVYTAKAKQNLYNSSVTYNPDKKIFIMALETDEDGFKAFTIRFLDSPDLNHWNYSSDKIFGEDIYVACPAIRYINGYYYLWYLKEVQFDPEQPKKTSYVVQLSKSSDLSGWSTSPDYALIPDRQDEGTNSSDIDFVEYEKKVFILYAIGDQVTWAKIKYATFDGSIEDWVKQFYFPDLVLKHR